MTSGQKAAVPQQPLRPNSARLQASAPGSGATPSLLGRRLQRYRACAPEAPQPAPAPRLRRAAHVGVAERRAATRQRSRLCGLGNHFGRSAVDGGIRRPVVRPRRRPRRGVRGRSSTHKSARARARGGNMMRTRGAQKKAGILSIFGHIFAVNAVATLCKGGVQEAPPARYSCLLHARLQGIAVPYMPAASNAIGWSPAPHRRAMAALR